MRTRAGHHIVAIAIALLFALIGVSTAVAQEKSLRWPRWDSDIQINKDGTFTVRELYEVEFVTGSFTFGYRSIPVFHFTSIEDVSVSEENTAYRESRAEAANTFYVEQSGDEYVINWFYPETTGATRVFAVEYTVVGGILVDAKVGDRFFWKAIGPDHAFPIGSSTVVVRMPPGAKVDATMSPAFFGADASYSIDPAFTSVTYLASNIPANQEFEVGVRFPHGFVPGIRPGWQAEYEREEQWNAVSRPMLNLLFGVVGVLLLIGGMVGVTLRYLFAGRDPEVAAVPSYLAEPPSDLPPGIVGTLVDEKADLQDIIATVVDLAKRGIIEMEEREKSIFGLVTSKEFVFHRKGDFAGDVRSYEKLLLDKVFGARDEMALNDLREEFYVVVPKLREQLYKESVSEGLFPVSPQAVRGRYLGLGIAGIVLSVGVCFCAMAGVQQVDMLAFPFVSLGVVSLSVAVVSSAMPVKTRKGAEEAAKWKAFREYLRTADKHNELSEATDLFERYLPYAVAFGLERDWINKFARVEGTPVPGWYFPVGVPYGSSGQRSLGRGMSGGMVSGGRDVRGEAARPGPTLDGMSEGAFRGLGSMSGGLFSMLNSTASVFTSVPRSSGGGMSGGGSGGGGFSGGGGGGGGGAGFG